MEHRDDGGDAILVLDEPWAPDRGRLGELTVLRGRDPSLRYADGIELEVVTLDARDFGSVEDAIDAADPRRHGQVTVLVGPVPLEWRAKLRAAGVSFIARTGAAEIRWPRLTVSAHRFEGDDHHRRSPVPLQKGRAVVAQELLARGPENPASITELAEATDVSPATASRAVKQLTEQGLVERQRRGRSVWVTVASPGALLRRLAERTPWPEGEAIPAYRWALNAQDVGREVCARAARGGIAVAVTGRAAAEAYGAVATRPARELRLWATPAMSTDDILSAIGAEDAPADEANIFVALDRRGYGLHRRGQRAPLQLANPVRVWCDLQDEPRGPDLADDLWRYAGGW